MRTKVFHMRMNHLNTQFHKYIKSNVTFIEMFYLGMPLRNSNPATRCDMTIIYVYNYMFTQFLLPDS